jgi:hypothetical protein
MRLAIFIFISTSFALLIRRCDTGYEDSAKFDDGLPSDALQWSTIVVYRCPRLGRFSCRYRYTSRR